MKKLICFLPLFISIFLDAQNYDVCIIGGGASGTAAAIQAARMGAKTIVVEETKWLGGALTSGGVSTLTGNHYLPSGLLAEFRLKLYEYYGGAKETETGLAATTSFEPHVAAKIFNDLALKEQYLTLSLSSKLLSIKSLPNDTEGYAWQVKIKSSKGKQSLKTRIIIDASELGDAAKMAKVATRTGTDDPSQTGENGFAVKQTDIIQDLTYTAILKTYGKGFAPIVKKPKNYDPSVYQCACATRCPKAESVIDCDKMLTYNKLPNGKYVINWKNNGNDFYANLLESSQKERCKALGKAKQHTLGFLYFIQNDLGYKNLGLADDEFTTKDLLPFQAYFRESRRTEGHTTLTVNHILKPFDQKEKLYRTGIAVGDYPIEQHYEGSKNNFSIPKAPAIPSFNVPLGSLIPKNVDNFIVAEKNISVTSLVNGTTHLPTCSMLIGQAAGALAATASLEKRSPSDVPVRLVQNFLLEKGCYLMPFYDVKANHPHFQAIQRIGATGLLRGVAEPNKWANRTWFYPDSTIQNKDFLPPFDDYGFDIKNMTPEQASRKVTVRDAVALAFAMMDNKPDVDFESFMGGVERNWEKRLNLKDFNADRPITRLEIAVLFDRIAKPFDKAVDLKGKVEIK